MDGICATRQTRGWVRVLAERVWKRLERVEPMFWLLTGIVAVFGGFLGALFQRLSGLLPNLPILIPAAAAVGGALLFVVYNLGWIAKFGQPVPDHGCAI